MSTNYQRGYATELRAKRILERRGWFVIRSAGSHSPVDLVALHPHRKPLLVQVKRNCYASRAERDSLRFLRTHLADVEIWRFMGRGRPIVEAL